MTGLERRILSQPLELRAADGATAPRITGYAALFNREAVIGGWFREQIAPGAFTTALAEDDVRALFNHDANYVLGRTTAGTLTLEADAIGLRYDCEPPATTWAADLLVTVARGDVTQSSFGFRVVKDSWTTPETSAELPLRTIEEARLYDVSPVTYPAYEDTTAEARDAASAARRPAAVPFVDHAGLAATVLRQKRQDIIEGLL